MSSSLVYRYNNELTDDGLEGEEGTFSMCTFWLVEALTRAGSVDHARLEEARVIFERMLGYANHLGLYAEGDRSSRRAPRQFPASVYASSTHQRGIQSRQGSGIVIVNAEAGG